jgi:enoyl-CoA hydratase/carnithine racemase
MSFEFIRVEKTAHVTTITLDRPERMNALHPTAHIELNQAFDRFQSDHEQWEAIVTGAGESAFCAGNDLKFQAEHGAA